MRLPRRLDVLRLRNFRQLFLGQLVSMIGDGLMPVALTFAILDLTHSGTDVGIVLGAASAPLMLLTLAGGVWADRLRRESVMIASDLVRFVTLATGVTLLLTGHAQVWSLAVLGFLYGCGDAFFFPAYAALVQQIVPAERFQEANAVRSMAEGFAWFVGPSISGILVALVGAGVTLGIDTVTFLVSAGFLLTLRVPAIVRTREPASFVTELHDGWKEVRSRTWLWTMMLRTMLVLFATIAPLQVLGPLAITEQHHKAWLWGLMVGLFSLGMLVGGLIALRYRPRRPMVLVTICGLTASAPMFALALSLSAFVLCLVWFVRGIAIGLLVAAWDTTLQREIPNESMARVSGWDWMTSNALWSVGLVIAGPIAESMGLTATLWLSGFVGIVAGAWVLLVPDVWRLQYRRGETASVERV